MNHPSFLQLDRHALGVLMPQLDSHLAGCEQCASHVARVRQPAPVPQSLAEAVRPRPFFRARLLWALAPVAVGLVLLVALPPAPDDVRAKGTPTVAVFVRRAEQVTRWDGKSPLRAADAVQLEVAPAGFRHLTIVQGTTVLYAAQIDAEKPWLVPQSWTLDAAPGPEHLTVALSQSALSPAELEQLAGAPRTARLWTLPLVLPRESSR